MNIAVPTTPDGQVDHGWGRSPRVAIAAVEDGKVVDWQVFDVEWDRLHDEGGEDSHHDRITGFLTDNKVERVAAQHMGNHMVVILGGMSIAVILGATGDARDAAVAAAAATVG